MPVEVVASRPASIERIAALMGDAFGVGRDAYFLRTEVLRWKYFDAPEEASLPRSYVLQQDDVALAHCGVVPLTLAAEGGAAGRWVCGVSGLAFMDWAGGRQMAGAGLILKKRLMAGAAVAVVAGGTPGTRAVLPRLGFEARADLLMLARVLRPLRQAARRGRSWRDAARAVRNTAWSLWPPRSVPPGWSAEPVASFATATVSGAALAPVRSAAYLNYWLRCPVGRTSGYALVRDGVRVGEFLMTVIGGQARLIDLRVASPAQQSSAKGASDGWPADDWYEAAARVAVQTAAASPEVCEVICATSVAPVARAFERAGFRVRHRLPLYVADPGGVLAGAPALSWTLADNDLAYLHDPRQPFLA